MSEKQEQVQPMDLSFFMPGVAEDVEEIKAPISARFKDKNGNIIPFIFKAIPTERVEELEKTSMKTVRHRNKVIGKEVDHPRFMARVAVESTVYPNFKADELRKAYKTEDPVEIAKKVLHVPGEYGEWLSKASEVNGFDDSIEDLEEAAKN